MWQKLWDTREKVSRVWNCIRNFSLAHTSWTAIVPFKAFVHFRKWRNKHLKSTSLRWGSTITPTGSVLISSPALMTFLLQLACSMILTHDIDSFRHELYFRMCETWRREENPPKKTSSVYQAAHANMSLGKGLKIRSSDDLISQTITRINSDTTDWILLRYLI